MNQQVSQSNMQAQLTGGTGSSGGHDRRGDDNRRNDRRPYYNNNNNNNRVEKRQRCTWCRGFGHLTNDCQYFSIYRMIGQIGLQLGQARQQQSRGRDRGRGRGRGFPFGQQRGGYYYQHHQYNNQVRQQQFVAPPANNQRTMRQAAERVNTPAAVQQAMANMREALRQRGLSEDDIDRVAWGQQPRQQGDGDTQNRR